MDSLQQIDFRTFGAKSFSRAAIDTIQFIGMNLRTFVAGAPVVALGYLLFSVVKGTPQGRQELENGLILQAIPLAMVVTTLFAIFLLFAPYRIYRTEIGTVETTVAQQKQNSTPLTIRSRSYSKRRTLNATSSTPLNRRLKTPGP